MSGIFFNERVCPDVQGTIELVGRRWNMSILVAAAAGACRFSELRAAIAGISDRMLAQRLKELQAEGLLDRTVIPSTPVQVLYAPTEDASQLLVALGSLGVWAEQRELRRMRLD